MTTPAAADSQRIVSLYADGQKRIVTTDVATVGEVLSRAGVQLASTDVVEPGTNTKLPQGFFNINVYRARPVVVFDGTRTYHLLTAHQSSRQIAADVGLTLYPEDQASFSVVTDFVADGGVGDRLVINRADPVTIVVDSKTLTLRTQTKTVGQLLASQGITLGASDTVSPALDYAIVPGLSVTVTRVSDAVVATTEVLPRSTQTVLDDTMARGTSQIRQAGSDGHQSVTYHIHYRNGVEVARETLSISNVVPATVKIVVQGTKVFFAGNIEYWRPQVTDAATAQGVSPDLMLGIMRCESNGNATASNGTHFGLYQYDYSTWSGVGGTMANIYDGSAQITATAWKIAHYGLSAWAASKFCWSQYQ